MARSKKGLIIRLTVVAAIIALGTFALMQAQNVSSNEEEKKPDDKVSKKEEDESDKDKKKEESSTDKSKSPPKPAPAPMPPTPTVIRANGGDENGFQLSLDDGPPPSSPPFQPPSQNFDDGGSLEVVQNDSNAAPPAQPPFDQFAQNPAPVTNDIPPSVPPSLSPDQFSPQQQPNALRSQDNSVNQLPLDHNPAPIANDFAQQNSADDFGKSATPAYSPPAVDYGNDQNYGGSSASSYAGGSASDELIDQTSSRPGPAQLEGTQTPALTLQKVAPAEIQVGHPAMFQLKIKNVGRVDAHGVTVVDQIPDGTRFVDASPQASRAGTGTLMWNLGELKSGAESTISVQLVPLTEGEIGSVATIGFQSKASVKTICTKPVLTVEHSGPTKVLIGQSAVFDIKVTNNGTGVAANVMLEEDVPEQLGHPAGNELEYEIGNLQPGETRQLRLTLQAKKAGAIENVLMVRGEGNLIAEHRAPIEVIAPELKVGVAGPGMRYLERQAKYTVAISNPGTAKATNVELVAHLPKGLKFINTNNHGQYNPQTHAVYWNLTELPANETGEVELTALPVEMGHQKLRIESKANLGLAASHEKDVKVEGLAAIFFGVADTADPIEVGSDTVYQVNVVNQGSKTATEVRVIAALPPGLQPVGGDGPTNYRIRGQTIEFDSLARLAPKGQANFKIQARGMQEGDHRIVVQVMTREVSTPVSKEESTRVYIDK